MKRRPEAILNEDGVFYTPRQHRAGTFKKASGVSIRLDFHPLIADQLYKQWLEHQVELYKISQSYLEARKKKDDKTLLDTSQQLNDLSQLTAEVGKKLISILIDSNDNPVEYSKDIWIECNLGAQDMSDLIEKAFSVSDEVKKK